MRAILDAKEKAAIVAAATMNVVDFFSDLFVMIQVRRAAASHQSQPAVPSRT